MPSRKGDGPRTGMANQLLFLGRGKCPECRDDLEPGGDSSLICPTCDQSYPVAGGVP